MKKILFLILICTSLGCVKKVNVRIGNGSVVEAVNYLNSHRYQDGDTLCIQSTIGEGWYVSEEMQDTLLYSTLYKIGVVVK